MGARMDDTLVLAERAAQGDTTALDRLLQEQLPGVRAFVRAHMGPQLRARESVSDLVQSICREILTHKARFRHPSAEAFQAWLYTMARRKVQNRARDLGRQKRAADREVPIGDDLGPLGAAYARISSPSGRVLRAEEVARLEAAIDQLPEEQREVITLAHLAGLSRAEIGVQMGRSEEAVRALLHRAKARLSMLLDEPPVA